VVLPQGRAQDGLCWSNNDVAGFRLFDMRRPIAPTTRFVPENAVDNRGIKTPSFPVYPKTWRLDVLVSLRAIIQDAQVSRIPRNVGILKSWPLNPAYPK
jgi:hypothetical protein